MDSIHLVLSQRKTDHSSNKFFVSAFLSQKIHNTVVLQAGDCVIFSEDLLNRSLELTQLCCSLQNADCLIHLIVVNSWCVVSEAYKPFPDIVCDQCSLGFEVALLLFVSCFEAEQRILVLDVQDSFVVAWEVVFKNKAPASREVHMQKGMVCMRMKLRCTMVRS